METTSRKKPRHPVAAVLLSLIAPGLGQIYCGRFAPGIVLVFVSLTLMPVGLFGFVPVASWFGSVAFLASLAFLAVWVWAMVDAGLTARRIGPDYELRDYNRWYVYAMLALLSVPIAVGVAAYIRSGVMEAFKVPSPSMFPSVRPGDRILVNKLAYRQGPVQRGDIVVFTHPNKRHQYHIKRVVALPGDTVALRGNELFVNGEVLSRTKAQGPPDRGAPELAGEVFEEKNRDSTYRVLIAPAGDKREKEDFPETAVPNGHCFVMGDNRGRSEDSRSYGPVPLSDIAGRAEHVILPRWESLLPRK